MNISSQTWTLNRYPLSCQVHIILLLGPYLPERQDVSFQNFCGLFSQPKAYIQARRVEVGAGRAFLSSQTHSGPLGRVPVRAVEFSVSVMLWTWRSLPGWGCVHRLSILSALPLQCGNVTGLLSPGSHSFQNPEKLALSRLFSQAAPLCPQSSLIT